MKHERDPPKANCFCVCFLVHDVPSKLRELVDVFVELGHLQLLEELLGLITLKPVKKLPILLLDPSSQTQEAVLIDERVILWHAVFLHLKLALFSFVPLVFLFRARDCLLPSLNVFGKENLSRAGVHKKVKGERHSVQHTQQVLMLHLLGSGLRLD